MLINDGSLTIMETIRAGLKQECSPGKENAAFVEAVYALFKEFADDYADEWERLNENEHIYRADHWYGMKQYGSKSENLPTPTTPIITSTIENIKADLSDEFPAAVISPDSPENTIAAKVLTKVVQQDLDVCGYDREYDKLIHDVLVDGWGVVEVGHDPDANNGIGSSYQRYVINKNFM